MGFFEIGFLATGLLLLKIACFNNFYRPLTEVVLWLDTAKKDFFISGGLTLAERVPAAHQAPDVEEAVNFIHKLLREASFRGESLMDHLGSIQIEFAASVRVAKDSQRILISLSLKIAMVLVLAVLGRLAVLAYGAAVVDVDQAPQDRYILLCALIALAVALYGIRAQAPKPWVWQEGLSGSARTWLVALVAGNGQFPDGWGVSWQRCIEHERFLGVDLSRDKAWILQDWVCKLRADEKSRADLFEAMMPIFEIVVGGGCALLVLIHPVMVVMGF